MEPALESLTQELLKQKVRKATAEANLTEVETAEKIKQFEFLKVADVRNRLIPFTGQVTDDSTEQAVDIISRWARQSTEPITVRFTSPGGDVEAGLVMYDTIRAFVEDGITIKTLVYGKASSMAAILLQAGSERVIAPHAYIMMHEGSVSAKNYTRKVTDMENDAKFQKRLQDDLVALVAERSKKLTATEIRARIKKGEWFMNATECVKFGFADRIGFK